jgi:hypothetical protein
MTYNEQITVFVVLVLMAALAAFLGAVESAGGFSAPLTPKIGWTVLSITVLSAFDAAAIRLRQKRGAVADERDGKVAFLAQTLRGYLYLGVLFLGFGYAIFAGHNLLANGLFVAILAIEIISGLALLVLYRRAG